MNTKIKDLLGMAVIIAVLGIAGAGLYYAYAYGKTSRQDNFRSFTVTGEGKVVGVPDVAEFTYTVVEVNKDLSQAQKLATDAVNKINEYFKQSGVDGKDIKTASYNVFPRYTHTDCFSRDSGEIRECPPPRISDYEVNISNTIKVRDAEKSGVFLSGVVERGADSVTGLNFVVDEKSALEQEAKSKAIEQAKVRAQAVADAGGFRLGKLLSIDDFYMPMPVESRTDFGFGSGDAKLAAPNISPGTNEFTASVTLRYEIK